MTAAQHYHQGPPVRVTTTSATAKPVTVSDVDELREQLRSLRGRVHALFNDDRLSHTQSAAVAALVDSLNGALSAAYVVKAVTS